MLDSTLVHKFKQSQLHMIIKIEDTKQTWNVVSLSILCDIRFIDYDVIIHKCNLYINEQWTTDWKLPQEQQQQMDKNHCFNRYREDV